MQRCASKFNMPIAIGYACILGLCIFFSYLLALDISGADTEVNFDDLPFPGNALAWWAMFGGLGLWIWMLSHYFREGPNKHRVFWGWILLFGHFIAASVYFFLIYLPLSRRQQ